MTVSVRGDNWLGIHEAALLRVAGLHPNCEVIDAQFRDDVQATPYCIMVDHIWRCVVVAIRGTMSLDDCLCDLQAEPVSMAESGRKWGFDGNDMFAHQVRGLEREVKKAFCSFRVSAREVLTELGVPKVTNRGHVPPNRGMFRRGGTSMYGLIFSVMLKSTVSLPYYLINRGY